MRAALSGVDHVRERVHRLGVGRVPLHRDLERHPVGLVTELDDRAVHRLLGGVQVAHEVGDAARVLVDHGARLAHQRPGGGRVGVLVVLGNGLGPLVGQRDPQAPVEERRLLQPPGQRLEVPLRGLEDQRVWPERRQGARLVRRLAANEVRHRGAALVGLRPDVAVPADLHVEPDGQRVHHRHADAVQAAGDRVGIPAELPAGVQRG